MKHIRTLVIALGTLAVFGITTAVVTARSIDPGRTSEQSGPSGVHLVPLSQATIGASVVAKSGDISIKTHGPQDMLVTSITVTPGGSFGWHTHPGPVLVAISKGTLTLYRPQSGRCVRSKFSAGQAFVEPGGDVHLARNEGPTRVKLNAIFLGPKGTTQWLTPLPEPNGCHI